MGGVKSWIPHPPFPPNTPLIPLRGQLSPYVQPLWPSCRPPIPPTPSTATPKSNPTKPTRPHPARSTFPLVQPFWPSCRLSIPFPLHYLKYGTISKGSYVASTRPDLVPTRYLWVFKILFHLQYIYNYLCTGRTTFLKLFTTKITVH